MKERKILKLKIAFAAIGIAFLLAVWVQIFKFHLAKSGELPGVVSLGLIIGFLIYMHIYRSLILLKNQQVHFIFKGVDVIQMVSVTLLVCVATIMCLIFLPHFIIAMIGFSFIAFAIQTGLKFIVFNYTSQTVHGLLENRNTTFDNLLVNAVHDDQQQIEIKTLDPGGLSVLKKEMYSQSAWARIVENLNRIRASNELTSIPQA